MKKTVMALATQLLGSSPSPERTKPSVEILQDVLLHAEDTGVRSNDGEAVITAELSELDSDPRRRLLDGE